MDGKVSNTFPSKGLYQIDITCDNADEIWDIDNWKLDIKILPEMFLVMYHLQVVPNFFLILLIQQVLPEK